MHDAFLADLWRYYDANRRDYLPWRQNLDPYHILVSELMLQQTQVARVIPKFEAFLHSFPHIGDLARTSLAEVLRAWQGLGYNRRAKFLWQTAQQVCEQYNGVLPADIETLITLPGIGPNTAGAIVAYAHNKPVLFLETNIRSVLIYHFFPDVEKVSDSELRTLLEELLPPANVRDFYWALMDYGTHLKETVGNHARRSAGYAKQSRFHGSDRQIRGQILRTLSAGPRQSVELIDTIADERAPRIISEMLAEQLIETDNTSYYLHGDTHA